MRITTVAALAFCMIAPAATALAGEQAAAGTALSGTTPATIVLAQNSGCRDRCTAAHNQCKRQGRKDCYTIMQRCWNACRRH